MTENEIGTILVDTAIEMHRHLGPGLLESVYEVVMAYELTLRGLDVKRQEPITIHYKHMKFEEAFRADLLVAQKVIVELKSGEKFTLDFGMEFSETSLAAVTLDGERWVGVLPSPIYQLAATYLTIPAKTP